MGLNRTAKGIVLVPTLLLGGAFLAAGSWLDGPAASNRGLAISLGGRPRRRKRAPLAADAPVLIGGLGPFGYSLRRLAKGNGHPRQRLAVWLGAMAPRRLALVSR